MLNQPFLFVCQRCKKLCFATRVNLVEDETPKNEDSTKLPISHKFSTSTIQGQKVLIDISTNGATLLEEYSSLFSDLIPNLPSFPLCNNCLRQFGDKISHKTTFYKEQSVVLKDQIIPKISLLINEMQKEVQNVSSQNSVLGEVTYSNRREARRLSSASGCSNSACSASSDQKDSPLNKSPPSFFKYGIKSSAGVPSLNLCTAFCIMSHNYFGSINGCRLAFSTPQLVPLDEISSALQFLCHMLYYCGTRMGTNLCGLSLEPLSFSGVLFNPADTKSRRTLESFNYCVMSLMQACNTLFDTMSEVMCNFAPPYPISLEDKKIDREKYIYKPAKSHVWTAAMKLLLFDFKVMQKCCLQLANFVLTPLEQDEQ